MFMLMFLLGLIGFVIGSLRFFVCWGAEHFKQDRFSESRKRAWKKVWIHFGVTFAFFYMAFRI